MNLARIPGQIFFGHLSDKVSARKLIIIMALVSSVSVYAIWGSVAAVHGGILSESSGSGTAGLLVFSMVFGAFAGRSVDVLCVTVLLSQYFVSYTALFPKFISIVAGEYSLGGGEQK